jgi:hypothetical protein
MDHTAHRIKCGTKARPNFAIGGIVRCIGVATAFRGAFKILRFLEEGHAARPHD